MLKCKTNQAVLMNDQFEEFRNELEKNYKIAIAGDDRDLEKDIWARIETLNELEFRWEEKC